MSPVDTALTAHLLIGAPVVSVDMRAAGVERERSLLAGLPPTATPSGPPCRATSRTASRHVTWSGDVGER
ncbi:hypothetical protein ACTG9Q_00635 [Actinokineospora sp. 24-640]